LTFNVGRETQSLYAGYLENLRKAEAVSTQPGWKIWVDKNKQRLEHETKAENQLILFWQKVFRKYPVLKDKSCLFYDSIACVVAQDATQKETKENEVLIRKLKTELKTCRLRNIQLTKDIQGLKERIIQNILKE